MQDDLSQRDLSGKRVQDMTQAERRELKRRFEEFVSMMRGGDAPPAAPKAKPQTWDPRQFGAKSIGRAGR